MNKSLEMNEEKFDARNGIKKKIIYIINAYIGEYSTNYYFILSYFY